MKSVFFATCVAKDKHEAMEGIYIKINIENLEKDLTNEKLNSLYLLYGDEIYLLENSLKKIKKIFGETVKGINYIQIDETNIEELLQDMQTPAFGYEKKLIIVKNTGTLFKKESKKRGAGEISKIKENIIQYIENNIDLINESLVIVFIEQEAELGDKLTKIIEKNGIICNFDKQKPIQIVKRLKKVINDYKVNCDEKTLNYLIECIRNFNAGFNK